MLTNLRDGGGSREGGKETGKPAKWTGIEAVKVQHLDDRLGFRGYACVKRDALVDAGVDSTVLLYRITPRRDKSDDCGVLLPQSLSLPLIYTEGFRGLHMD